MQDLFDWTIRWEGRAKDDGYTIHVGDRDSYVALYAPLTALKDNEKRYIRNASLNHLGVVVKDLAATQTRVIAAGFTPHSHADYEPGERFYFDGPENIEIEVVSYAK